MFDWLRTLYENLRYNVEMDDVLSEEFVSLIGILTGDSASPDLWNAYFGDFRPPCDPDDVELGQELVCTMEQADDTVLVSLSPTGMQRRLLYTEEYSGMKFIDINVPKTRMMVDGIVPSSVTASTFVLNGVPIQFTSEYTYVGVTFASGHRNIFARHYEKKAVTARGIANTIFSVETFIGSLPPLQGKRLYNSRVDPHLTSACEIVIDIDKTLLAPLQKIQHTYLQRLIGLNPRAMRAFLFSETGILPLAYRRVILALKYLRYILSLPASHLAACAWRECLELFYVGKACWLGDLAIVLRKMPFKTPVFNPLEFSRESITTLIDDVTLAAKAHVDNQIQKSSKGALLIGRLHPGEKGKLTHESMAFRQYLLVSIPEHRKALAALLLADHRLAEVRMRYNDTLGRRQPAVPHRWRLCRFCGSEIEDTLHALFLCDGSEELAALRQAFWESCGAQTAMLLNGHTAKQALHHLLLDELLVNKLARYSYLALEIYMRTDLLWPLADCYAGEAPEPSDRPRDIDVML
ncbi:hypothetical protein FIBSPDRAFT_756733 [Athelia psychrophila]|uniref:Reverse transcriptase zinc-binding domain-containing protein n=1 Tax=Athelia psychrophila TaxID=1759441 RepID=A0A166AAC4_9AGAM|nr:hypothetical protein FIBSPDRAFT_756733 [Fibularhizoctonia sp. CBS 109695]